MVNIAVVTEVLQEKWLQIIKPKAIVAIACERDLTEGILDTSPISVLGIEY